MSKRKKVLILGDIRGVYRIQNVVKYFVDRPKEYAINLNTSWCKCRPLKYIKSLIFDPFTVAFSNMVYVNILNVDVDILYQLFWARLFRKKIIVDYYISIYEKVVADEKWFKEKSILAKLAKKLDKYYYNSATKAVFLDEAEQEHYCEIINAKEKQKNRKNVVIPLCVEKNTKVDFEKIYSKPEFSICWWGSYLPLHGLDKIFKAAQIVKNSNKNIKWYFFGNSDEKAVPYIKMAEGLGILDVCKFENSFTMKNGKLTNFLVDNCSLAMGNFGDSVKARLVMNNKVVDACAMGMVVLTGNAKAYNCFFDEKKDIYMSDIEPEEIARNVLEIYNTETEILRKRAVNTYNIYEEYFTPEVFYKKFENLLNEIYQK